MTGLFTAGLRDGLLVTLVVVFLVVTFGFDPVSAIVGGVLGLVVGRVGPFVHEIVGGDEEVSS